MESNNIYEFLLGEVTRDMGDIEPPVLSTTRVDPLRFICPKCGNESYSVINNTHYCGSAVCNGRARWHDTYWKDLTDYDEVFKPTFPKRAN